MLYVVATPIGNLSDLSPRAQEALRKADVIAAEDTRRTRQLLTHFDIPAPRLISYREQTERSLAGRLVEQLQAGATLALCTDGGYPGISDPGYRLIREAVQADIPMEVIPGASAVPVALLSSGLPTSSYTFKGFPPRKRGQMERFFHEEADRPHTLVIFESPMRVGKTLEVALEVLGNREAAVCVELTKLHERVYRGYLADLLVELGERRIKGEVTMVFAGSNPKFTRSGGDDATDEAAAG
jgi:16S rRNA (cytidine1402-2'-O)-methyltransferase